MLPHENLLLRGALWKATGSDSAFLLTPKRSLMPQGWYMLSLQLEADIPILNVKLYPDYGSGFQEEQTFSLPVRNRHLTKRLCYFPSMPKRIRLNPSDTSCTFKISCLCLSKVTKRFAIDRMERKIHGNTKFQRVNQTKKAHISLEILRQRYDNLFSQQPAGPSYREWIDQNENLQNSELELAEARYEPLISIVVPIWNTPADLLRKCIESVQRQTYQHWQLCLADDASTLPHVKGIIASYAASDRRIECVFREENGHICRASNSALELATGEYVALLDHDDELAPDALYWVIEALNKNPSARLLYSDEDKIDEEGRRFDPHFKSEWNQDMFFSQNYLSHLGVYQRELLSLVGGFRLGVEGSQDHDLVLRCLPHLHPEEIVHIPRVLYHWRTAEGSTAKEAAEKTYTTDAGIKALQDYFDTEGTVGTTVTEGLVPNTYRVLYPIPEMRPLVSLLIPTRDSVNLLESCVRSIIEKTTYNNYEIIIIDNGSAQAETLAFFETITREDSRIKVIPYNLPFNYSAINNYGVEQAKGEVIGLVNNDIEVISPEWLEEMLRHAVRPEIGCVGAKLYYEDDTIQHAGVIVGIGGVAGHSHKGYPRMKPGYFSRLKIVQNLSAVTAACLLVRKSVYVQVGGLDEESLQVAFNDVDFCLKVRMAGYRNLWTPYAELYHYESKSRGYEDTPEKARRFKSEVEYMENKWGQLLKADPYYSPNLTLVREDFSLK